MINGVKYHVRLDIIWKMCASVVTAKIPAKTMAAASLGL
jgi:hypothetical protein